MKRILGISLLPLLAFAQPRIPGAPPIRFWTPVGAGTLASRPTTCVANRDVYMCTGAGCTPGNNFHYCTATDTFTAQGVAGGTGITSFNGLSGASQSFVNDTNVTVVSSGTTHTMTWAGTLAAGRLNANVAQAITNDTNVTGSISSQTLTLGWTGTLAKARIISTAVFNDQTNTYSAGTQDFTSTAALVSRIAAGCAPTANGSLCYDSTANAYKFGVNTATKTVMMIDTALQASQVPNSLITNAMLAGSIDLTAKVTGALPLANGGTNGTDAANNGGIIWSNASGYKILAGTATAGLPLLSGATATPAWGVAPATQKFFGTAAPGSVSGNLPGDVFSDTTNHHAYWCNATSGTVAPACTSVSNNGWTQLDGAGSGGLNSFTSPNNSIVIGGSLTTPTVDVSTAYLNGLYAQTGAASIYTAGAKQTFQPSTTTAGVRISNTTLPSSTGGLAAGDLFVTTGSVFSLYDGVNINLIPGLVGSGVSLPSAPTAGHQVVWGSGYTIQDGGAPGSGGTVTNIATSSPLSGGAITTTGTLSCPTCTITVANGTSSMGTGAITSGTCATVVTTTATGTATTDTIAASFNGDPTGVTGYIPATTGMLTIIPYPTTNNVNFKVCNNTGSSITPGAITLNWRVTR